MSRWTWWLFLGLFGLLAHLTNSKPVKLKGQTDELIREKRSNVEDDDAGTANEMQTFMLDLSTKEDMQRLRERFTKFQTRDVENDEEYRRLKRFSVSGEQEEISPSGSVTMERRSSRRMREDEDRTSSERSSSQSPSLVDKPSSSNASSSTKQKRSDLLLVKAFSKRSSQDRDDESANEDNSGSGSPSENDVDIDEPAENDSSGSGSSSEDGDVLDGELANKDNSGSGSPSENDGDIDNEPAENDSSGSGSPSEDADDVGESDELSNEVENSDIFDNRSLIEYQKDLESEPDGIEDTGTGAPGEEAGTRVRRSFRVNYHEVGDTWELIHHDPSGSLPSLFNTNATMQRETIMHSGSNTTVHHEYLPDDVPNDVEQYKRSEKSSRQPRLSRIRVVRSIEPEYEIQEISAVYNEKLDSPDEESGHVIAVNKKPIESDGYLGCFLDQYPDRDLIKSFSINDLTPDSCRTICKEKDHAYTGVQYGYLCHCGDSYGKYGHAAEDECNSACRGNENKKCGGFWRNSVYATDISGENKDDAELENRSQIERIIPLPESKNEDIPVHQEITAYLRADTPKVPAQKTPTITTSDHITPHKSSSADKPSKKSVIPSPTTESSRAVKIDQRAYLHPQNIQRSFIPSNIVLKTLQPAQGKRTYLGTVKLKQNWNDNLKNLKSPKTLILAGNIESAFSQMFDMDKDFEKADVLGFREVTIRSHPSNIHRVLVEFALTFKKTARGKDQKLREMVENSNKLDDMPVFGYTIQVKEYNKDKDISEQSKVSKVKDTREAPLDNQLEDKGGVDPFLEKVFSQI